jgi:hypothetical protein
MLGFGRWVLGLVPLAVLALPQRAGHGGPTYRDVAPIFKKSCVPCHSGKKPAHGLDLSSYASIMKGDKSGRVVTPGKPTASRLATVLYGKPQPMPPGDSLTAAQTAKIESWIRRGALNR